VCDFGLQVDGPLVLQLQKARNVCIPKTLEDSAVNSTGPQLLRLTLTDGQQTICALDMDGQTSLGYYTLFFFLWIIVTISMSCLVNRMYV